MKGKEETFDAEKTLKQDDRHDRFWEFDTDAEQSEFNGYGRKQRHEETSEHSNRSDRANRKSARPRFLLERKRCSKEIKSNKM